jgi:hypothetical protein
MQMDRQWKAWVAITTMCALALQCHPRSPGDTTEDPMTTTNDCTVSLRALATGEYAAWHGLTDHCTTAHAVAALGTPPDSADHVGDLGGSPTRYRIHPATAAAPHGIYVWDVDDRLVLVRIHEATPALPVLAQLGEPDARDMSRMPGFKTQWIYASRGLTLHIDDDTGEVAFVYAIIQYIAGANVRFQLPIPARHEPRGLAGGRGAASG